MNVTDGSLPAKQSNQRMDRQRYCPDSTRDVPPHVEQVAWQRLMSDCSFAFYFREIAVQFTEGRLTVRGRVPTFYLKQILHSRLKDLDGVEHIDDRVDVVSSTGLSSTRT